MILLSMPARHDVKKNNRNQGAASRAEPPLLIETRVRLVKNN